MQFSWVSLVAAILLYAAVTTAVPVAKPEDPVPETENAPEAPAEAKETPAAKPAEAEAKKEDVSPKSEALETKHDPSLPTVKASPSEPTAPSLNGTDPTVAGQPAAWNREKWSEEANKWIQSFNSKVNWTAVNWSDTIKNFNYTALQNPYGSTPFGAILPPVASPVAAFPGFQAAGSLGIPAAALPPVSTPFAAGWGGQSFALASPNLQQPGAVVAYNPNQQAGNRVQAAPVPVPVVAPFSAPAQTAFAPAAPQAFPAYAFAQPVLTAQSQPLSPLQAWAAPGAELAPPQLATLPLSEVPLLTADAAQFASFPAAAPLPFASPYPGFAQTSGWEAFPPPSPIEAGGGFEGGLAASAPFGFGGPGQLIAAEPVPGTPLQTQPDFNGWTK